MKRALCWSVCCALLLLAVVRPPARAAELKLSIAYETSYLPDFSPAPYTFEDGVPLPPGTVAPDDIHQFGLYFELAGTTESPDESLAGILADIELGPGLIPSPLGSYSPTISPIFYPVPGIPEGNLLFPTNEDAGVDDLKRITVVSDRLAAQHFDPGESAPFYLGSFFVQWDAAAAPVTSLYASPAASAPTDPWALWADNTFVPQGPENFFRSMNPPGPTMGFDLGIIPEPSSLVLASFGILAAITWARHRGRELN